MWDEYHRCVERWRKAGDAARLALPAFYRQGWECHEKAPDRSFDLFTRGRDEAARLGEPWWVLFFESWRLSALTAYSMDFARALPLAMELLPRVCTVAARSHGCRNVIFMNALYAYISADAVGYQQEIEAGLAQFDADFTLPSDRYVLNNRRVRYLSHVERWKEAYEAAMAALALAEGDPDARVWHGARILYEVCRICDALGMEDRLADSSAAMAELSARHAQLLRTRADASLWQAVVERRAGREREASRLFFTGMRLLDGLERRDAICADAVARYHEACGDSRSAFHVRDREIADVTKNGQLLRAAQLHLERCRLLSTLGEVSEADFAAVREAASKLRKPEWILRKLPVFGGG